MTNIKYSCSSLKHCVRTALLMKHARTRTHTTHLSMAQQPLVDQAFLIIETSSLHSVGPSG